MRSLLLAIVVSLTACATSSTSGASRPTNVHAVRMEIKGEIARNPGEPGPRSIVSVGKVRSDLAVVYTQKAGAPRHEETWVRGPSGWTLQSAVAIAARAR